MVCERLRAQGRVELDRQTRERRRGGGRRRIEARDGDKAGCGIQASDKRFDAEACAEYPFNFGDLIVKVKAAGVPLCAPTLATKKQRRR